MSIYKELDYLQSTGTQYIKQGFSLTAGCTTDIYCDFEYTTADSGQSLNGNYDGNANARGVYLNSGSSSGQRFRLAAGGSAVNTSITTSSLLNARKKLHVAVDDTNKTRAIYDEDGTAMVSETYTGNIATNEQYLFANYMSQTNTASEFASVKMYSWKQLIDGVAVRDYIPVLDFNDTPCMYDKVSDTYFYNQGTGSFLYSRKGYCYEVDYLESTGTQYIDTGLDSSIHTGGSFDITMSTNEYSSRFIGCGDLSANNKNLGLTVSLAGGIAFVYSGTWSDTSSVAYTLNQRVNVVFEFSDGSQKLYVDGVLKQSGSTAWSDTQTYPLCLFKYSGSTYTKNVKIFACKIYSGTTLVRDYIPVLDWDMRPCMYDKVTGEKYYNKGTGQFLYGVSNTESSIVMKRKLAQVLASRQGNYTLLKYLQGDGNSYIDTGYTVNSNCSFEIAFAPISTTVTSNICGVVKVVGTAESNRFQVICNNNYHKIGVGIGDGYITYGSAGTLDYVDGDTYVVNLSAKKTTAIYNGTIAQPTGGSWSNNVEANSFWLFNVNGTPASRGASIVRIHSFRLFDNGVVVRDMIPVLDNDGTPCIYDRVTNAFFYNKGTGTFTYEEQDYVPVDYVYANGNAYTSTMLYGDSNTKMEMTFDIAEQAAGNTGSMGSRISANSQLLAIGYGSALAADFNNSSYSPYRAAIVYETNKKYRAYTSKEKRSIVDEATGTVLAENNTLCSDTLSTDILLLGAETGISNTHVGNIYSAKVWDGDTVIRDYIPVVDGTNRAGFYDKCLNIVFYSLGTSDFTGYLGSYKVVRYLQSTGTQYINTGWGSSEGFIGDLTLLMPATEDRNSCICGNTNAQGQQRNFLLYHRSYGFLVGIGGTGDTAYIYDQSKPVVANTIYRIKFSTAQPNTFLKIDDYLINKSITKQTATSANVWLFNLNYVNHNWPGRIYRATIWDKYGFLKRKYVPCVNTSNTPCMLDISTNTPYYNAGSGTFVYG